MEAAPELVPPSEAEPEEPMFTIHDLEFIGIDIIDNSRYILFNTGYEIVKIKEFEYYEFYAYCLDELERCTIEGIECSCVLCTPTYEEDPITMASAVDKATKESIPLKTYICSNLLKGCQTSIHDKH